MRSVISWWIMVFISAREMSRLLCVQVPDPRAVRWLCDQVICGSLLSKDLGSCLCLFSLHQVRKLSSKLGLLFSLLYLTLTYGSHLDQERFGNNCPCCIHIHVHLMCLLLCNTGTGRAAWALLALTYWAAWKLKHIPRAEWSLRGQCHLQGLKTIHLNNGHIKEASHLDHYILRQKHNITGKRVQNFSRLTILICHSLPWNMMCSRSSQRC